MNCKAAVEMLSAYLDRELPPQERDAVRAHLADCHDCRVEERDLRALKGLLLGVRAPEPAPDFEQRLMSCLREQPTVKTRFELPRLRPMVLGQLGGLAAAACLAAFVAVQSPQPRPSSPRQEAPVAVANNLDYEIEAQRSDAYSEGTDLLSGPSLLTPASHVP